MPGYLIIEARAKNDLDELCNSSALTIEGLDTDSICDFADDVVVGRWIKWLLPVVSS